MRARVTRTRAWWRGRPLAVVALTLALGAAGSVFGISGAAGAGAAPTAQFAWKMADRFGLDVQAPANVIDYRTDDAFVSPSSWQVYLDACVDGQDPSALTYTWTFSKAGEATITQTRAGA